MSFKHFNKQYKKQTYFANNNSEQHRSQNLICFLCDEDDDDNDTGVECSFPTGIDNVHESQCPKLSSNHVLSATCIP